MLNQRKRRKLEFFAIYLVIYGCMWNLPSVYDKIMYKNKRSRGLKDKI